MTKKKFHRVSLLSLFAMTLLIIGFTFAGGTEPKGSQYDDYFEMIGTTNESYSTINYEENDSGFIIRGKETVQGNFLLKIKDTNEEIRCFEQLNGFYINSSRGIGENRIVPLSENTLALGIDQGKFLELSMDGGLYTTCISLNGENVINPDAVFGHIGYSAAKREIEPKDKEESDGEIEITINNNDKEKGDEETEIIIDNNDNSQYRIQAGIESSNEEVHFNELLFLIGSENISAQGMITDNNQSNPGEVHYGDGDYEGYRTRYRGSALTRNLEFLPPAQYTGETWYTTGLEVNIKVYGITGYTREISGDIIQGMTGIFESDNAETIVKLTEGTGIKNIQYFGYFTNMQNEQRVHVETYPITLQPIPEISINGPENNWATIKHISATSNDASNMYYSTGTDNPVCDSNSMSSYIPGSEITLTEDSNDTYVSFFATNDRGTDCKYAKITQIDNTAPTYTIINNSPVPECSTGTVTINANDGLGVGLHDTKPYKWNGVYSTSPTYSSYKTTTGQESINVVIMDKLENTTGETIVIQRIDSELHVSTEKNLGELTGTKIINNIITDLDVRAGDCETITIVDILEQNQATCTLQNEKLTIEPTTNYNGNGYCTIEFTDGDTTKTGKYVFTINTVVEVSELILTLDPEGTNGGWIRNTITVDMNARNASGAKYYIGAAGITQSTCRANGNPLSPIQGNTTRYQGEATISDNGVNYLYLCAESLTGEINMISGIYKIDREGPAGEVTYINGNLEYGNSCTTGNITIKLNTLESISGYPELAFARNSTGNTAWTSNNTRTVTENEFGTGYIRDNAGNILPLPYNVTGIVTAGPTVPILSTPRNGVTISSSNIEFNWEGSTPNNCATIDGYTMYILSSENGERSNPRSGNTVGTSITPISLPNGTYTRFVGVSDNFGQTGVSETRTFTINSEIPTCNIRYDPEYAEGFWTNGNVTGTLSCSDSSVTIITGTNVFTQNGDLPFSFKDTSDNTWIITGHVNRIDKQAPILTELTEILETENRTPNYRFNSSEAGTISYNGSCSGNSTQAIAGNNTITFNELEIGYHSDCSITVTDIAGNNGTLNITPFTIAEHSAPTTALIGWGTHTIPNMWKQDITVDIRRHQGATGGVIITGTKDTDLINQYSVFIPVTTGTYTMNIHDEDQNDRYVCAFATTGGRIEKICSEYPIKIDRTIPSLQLINPTNYSGDTVTLQWSGHDEQSGISGYTLTITDPDNNTETYYYYDSGTTSKSHTINKSGTRQRSVTVNDIVGNSGQNTGTFVVPYSGGTNVSGFHLISPLLGDQINLGENVVLSWLPGTTNSGYIREVKDISGTIIASGDTTSLTANINSGLFTTGAYSWSVKDIASETTKTTPLFYIVDSQNLPDLKVTQFEFDEIEDAKLDEYYQSNTITIKGLSYDWYSYAYLQNGIGALYINDKFVGTNGFIKNGDEIFIEMKASDEYNETVQTTLIVGGGENAISGNFKIINENGINGRDDSSLNPMQKLRGIIFIDSLVEMYQYDEERLATFLSTFMQLLQDKSDYYAQEILEAHIDGDEELEAEYKVYKNAIDFLYTIVKYRYDDIEVEDNTVYIAPNGKQYLVEYDEDRMAYTSPDFARPKYFPTWELFTNHIDMNNPAVGKWGIIGNVITTHNGKVYTIYETNGKWTSSNFRTAKYFDTKEDIINHILANNPASDWNHTIDTDFDEVKYTAPNGKIYKIFKTSSKGNNPNMYSSYNFINAKYFTSLEAAKKFIDQNNKK